MKKILVLAFIMVIAAASSSFAYKIGQDANEFTVYGAIMSSSADGADTVDTTVLAVGYNRFLTNEVSGGINVMQVGAESAGEKATMTYIEVNGKYHIIQQGQPLVPYVGLYLGRVTIDAGGESASGTEIKPAAGVKYFVSENASVNAELSYAWYSIESVDVTTTMLNFGLSVYF